MTDSIERTLGRLDGKMDMVLESLKEGRVVIEALDQRTGSLERWRSYVMGGAFVAGILGGIAVKILS